jgi:hypothetical protein
MTSKGRKLSFVWFIILFYNISPCGHRAFFSALNSASDKLYVVSIRSQSGSLLSKGKESKLKGGMLPAFPRRSFCFAEARSSAMVLAFRLKFEFFLKSIRNSDENSDNFFSLRAGGLGGSKF